MEELESNKRTFLNDNSDIVDDDDDDVADGPISVMIWQNSRG